MISTSTILPMAVAALAAPFASASAPAIDFAIGGCDGDGPFINLDVDVACKGSAGGDASSCAFGDTAVVEGTVYARQAFSDADVTIKACVLDVCPIARDAGTLCDWLVPTGGDDVQECGDAGSYDVSGGAEVPGSGRLAWLSRVVDVRIGVDEDCDGGSGGEESGWPSFDMPAATGQVRWDVVGMSLSAAGGALAALKCADARKRRRRRRRRSDDGEDEEGSQYVEMTDSDSTAVV